MLSPFPGMGRESIVSNTDTSRISGLSLYSCSPQWHSFSSVFAHRRNELGRGVFGVAVPL